MKSCLVYVTSTLYYRISPYLDIKGSQNIPLPESVRELQIRRANEDQEDNFSYFSMKIYVVTPH